MRLRVIDTAHLFVLSVPLKSYQKGVAWKELIEKCVKLSGSAPQLNGSAEMEYSIELEPPEQWNSGDVYSVSSHRIRESVRFAG